MKKQIINKLLLLFVGTGTLIAGCKKSDFNDKYYNPETSVTASVPTLYAGLFNNSYVIPKYWNLYTLLIPVFGEYSQTCGYTNVNKVYEQPVNYTGNKWDNYYTSVLAQYREIEKYYNNLTSATDKNGYQVFLETARIFFYDQTAQMVDLWGDIPYTKAGSLNSSGTIAPPAYDDAKTIYTSILNDLSRINSYLDTVNLNSFYSQQLTAYDYVNGGSLIKWRKYANALRLRMAMRISNYDEATAKGIVMGMLNNATSNPLPLTAAENVQINLKGNLISTSNDMQNGFGVDPFAPGYMVDSLMLPTVDPRLPFFFTKNSLGTYHGVSNTTNSSDVGAGQQAGLYSRWDSTTYQQNNNFPGLIITAAETNFSVAEAQQRWGDPVAASNAYNKGITESINFYYTINSSSSFGGTKQPMPTATAIMAFLANPAIALGPDPKENLKRIGTQKWVNFNVIQANQAWCEYRRTKYPVLYFPTDNASLMAHQPPTRLLYPASETSLNTANYQAVQAKDNITTKIFWDVK